jgi:carbonic anhydrase
MNRLIPVRTLSDILPRYRGTPIESLLAYQNLSAPHGTHDKAELLIGMCMDNRKHLRIPENFAFIIRAGGGNLRYSEFKVSYAIAIGGVSAIALLAHTNCGMVNLMSRREQFIAGLVQRGGWDQEWAEQHFTHFSPMFEIGNEVDFVLSEAKRLRLRYPKILVAPLMYRVEDNLLYQLREDGT